MAANPLLIVAHPGHELRVCHWLEQQRPLVAVVTDGSGSVNDSRMDSTRTVLNAVGAKPSSLFGRVSDRILYEAILNQDYPFFLDLASEIAELIELTDAELVVGDAVEGYNPSHDICRLMINAAVGRVNLSRTRSIKNYDFLLVGSPRECPEMLRETAIWLTLDPSALERKLTLALEYEELRGEVEAIVAKYGKEAFAIECLREVKTSEQFGILSQLPPEYERFGEKQVSAGHYSKVIRYEEHIVPIMNELNRWVTSVETRADSGL